MQANRAKSELSSYQAAAYVVALVFARQTSLLLESEHAVRQVAMLTTTLIDAKPLL
jgi:hypothetical protein